MRVASISLLLAISFIVQGSDLGVESKLELLAAPQVAVPPHDCQTRDYMCQATISFLVDVTGHVIDANIMESSRSRPCDRALRASVMGRVYKEIGEPLLVQERVTGYQCINGRPANNSFKPTPLRGAA